MSIRHCGAILVAVAAMLVLVATPEARAVAAAKHRPRPAAFVAAPLSGAAPALRVKNVDCGQDLDDAVNSDPAGTATQFRLDGCAYRVDHSVKTEDGDQIVGPAGTFLRRGPAQDPTNVDAVIQGTPRVERVIKPRGTVTLKWVRVQGGTFDGKAGTGTGVAMGRAAADSRLFAVVVRDNEGAGVSNAHGVLDSVELTNNTTNEEAIGFIAAGVKGVEEFEVVRSFVHGTRGNGIWCDEFCRDSRTPSGKYHVSDSLVVNNGRDGIRWEKVGTDASSGEALIEGNEVHGNGRFVLRPGVGIRDAANGVVRNNHFGATTIAGVRYAGSSYGAIRASDSKRTDRPDLADITIANNALNGETIGGCHLTGIVSCGGNAP